MIRSVAFDGEEVDARRDGGGGVDVVDAEVAELHAIAVASTLDDAHDASRGLVGRCLVVAASTCNVAGVAQYCRTTGFSKLENENLEWGNTNRLIRNSVVNKLISKFQVVKQE